MEVHLDTLSESFDNHYFKKNRKLTQKTTVIINFKCIKLVEIRDKNTEAYIHEHCSNFPQDL